MNEVYSFNILCVPQGYLEIISGFLVCFISFFQFSLFGLSLGFFGFISACLGSSGLLDLHLHSFGFIWALLGSFGLLYVPLSFLGF